MYADLDLCLSTWMDGKYVKNNRSLLVIHVLIQVTITARGETTGLRALIDKASVEIVLVRLGKIVKIKFVSVVK